MVFLPWDGLASVAMSSCSRWMEDFLQIKISVYPVLKKMENTYLARPRGAAVPLFDDLVIDLGTGGWLRLGGMVVG